MNFSLWNFKEWFERQGIDLSYMISDNTASISMLSTVDSASEGRLGCALVQPGEQLTDCTGFHTVLRFGSDRILFPVASPAEVLDAGAAMIEYYLDWENSLFDAITAGRPPEELVQLSQTVFPFPAAFFLPSGAPFFQTAGWSLPLNAQRIQPLLQNLSQAHPFFRTLFLERPHTFLSEVLFSNKSPRGLLTAYEAQKKFQPGDIHIFHTLASSICTALCFRSDALAASHPLTTWFTRSITAPAGSAPAPPSMLAQLGWQPDDCYVIASIYLSDCENPLSALIAAFTDSNHCCAIPPESLCMLIRLSHNDLTDEIEYLRRHGLADSHRIGLSLPFQGLDRLPQFYQQSLWAVQYAQRKSLYLVSIQELLPQAIRRACRAIPHAQAMGHPSIRKLAAAGLHDGDHLLETLSAYLTFGCSASQTADALFIHRNTLRSRLQKIQSIIPIPCNDPVLREQYLLSLLLYTATES